MRLVKYLKQTFLEDINLALLLTSLMLTIFCWSIGIFVWGLELLLFPIMFSIAILMLCGPLILIDYWIRKNREGGLQTKRPGRLKSLVFGAYIGFIMLRPITTWDDEQRQKGGLIVSNNLETYKAKHGRYPPDLLKIRNNLQDLPSTYPIEKFSYHLKSDSVYDLDIPIPIMDRWHWDKEKEVFELDDF